MNLSSRHVIPEVETTVCHKPRSRPPFVHILAALAFLALIGGCSGLAATPSPTAAPTATPPPTPVMTRATMTFGTKVNSATLAVSDPKTSFKRTVPAIAYSVVLNGPVGSTTITQILVRQSASGAETVIDRYDFNNSDPDNDVLANTEDLASLAGNKAGTYVLRLLRGDTVIAEGTFKLT